MPIKAINYIRFSKLKKIVKITLNTIPLNKDLSSGKPDTPKTLYNYKHISSIIDNNLFYN